MREFDPLEDDDLVDSILDTWRSFSTHHLLAIYTAGSSYLVYYLFLFPEEHFVRAVDNCNGHSYMDIFAPSYNEIRSCFGTIIPELGKIPPAATLPTAVRRTIINVYLYSLNIKYEITIPEDHLDHDENETYD